MPNIKPVSDLRNYNEVLRDVSEGSPVFLTKNGRGCCVLIDIAEYEKLKATLWLTNELAKGRKAGREQGYIPLEEVEARLGITG
ncbi:MAG: type II toxin-antitoxin system prevent-host-death family antitoxin [Oscillospiraceae bacterium]|nr:type II toxin-antitoxin system prevent-host-death family antitoxin [Oscillospiraceae bacterium]